MMSIYQLNNSYIVPFTSHHKIYLKYYLCLISQRNSQITYFINTKLSAGTIPIILHTNMALMCHDRTKRLFTKLIIYPPFLVNNISVCITLSFVNTSAGGWEWKGFSNLRLLKVRRYNYTINGCFYNLSLQLKSR